MTELTLAESTSGDVAVLAVSGDCDVYGAPKLRESLQRLAESHSCIVLDLSACTFLDAFGLSVVKNGLTSVRVRGGDLVIAGAPEACLKMFRVTGLVKVLRTYESQAAAVAAHERGEW